MSALGEVLGGKHLFEYKGKTYEVSLINDRIMLAFERALFARAREVARELRDLMSPDEYRAHLKQLSDDYISGAYSWGAKGMESLRSTRGMLSIASLLFGVSESEMLNILVERSQEVVALLDVVIHESFPSLPATPAEAGGNGVAGEAAPKNSGGPAPSATSA